MKMHTQSPFFMALKQRKDLEKYGENAHAFYALELFYSLDDVHSELSEASTEGGDDCKIDLLYVSRESKSIVCCQVYKSRKDRLNALGGKGQDLAFAMSALLSLPESDIPDGIKYHVLDAREAIKNDDIRVIHTWYIHNCPESSNVQVQMEPVLESARAQLRDKFPNIDVDISMKEVGIETLDEFYRASKSAILVDNEFIFESPLPGFRKQSSSWESFITTVPGSFLSSLYTEHKDELFSANVRGFMGSNKKDKDKRINAGIQESATKNASDFYVFNNGVTALVSDYELDITEENNVGVIKSIKGISIVNGAQTTGSLGTLKDVDLSDIEVGIRFIKCAEIDKIKSITQANNSQNQVIPSDFRSGDSIQTSLRNGFKKIPCAEYDGALRAEFNGDKKLRIDSQSVAQCLMAWHGSPYHSYHDKTKIWEDNDLYDLAFRKDITAEHLFFVDTLSEAIEEYKQKVLDLKKAGELTSDDREVLNYMNMRGSKFLLIHAISKSFEAIIGKPIKNEYGICFKNSSDKHLCIKHWQPVLDIALIFTQQLQPGVSGRLSDKQKITSSVTSFRQQMSAIIKMQKPRPFQSFVKQLKN
ncbi:TPA: AIPR family protein [Vibrio alginolyticus]